MHMEVRGKPEGVHFSFCHVSPRTSVDSLFTLKIFLFFQNSIKCILIVLAPISCLTSLRFTPTPHSSICTFFFFLYLIFTFKDIFNYISLTTKGHKPPNSKTQKISQQFFSVDQVTPRYIVQRSY